MKCESRIARFSIIHYTVMAINASVILFHQPIRVISLEPDGLTMRYWVLSVRALSLYLFNKEAPSPKLLATGQLTLGGTCWQSPKTTTCLDELNVTMGIIHSGSEAMPQLSITT